MGKVIDTWIVECEGDGGVFFVSSDEIPNINDYGYLIDDDDLDYDEWLANYHSF